MTPVRSFYRLIFNSSFSTNANTTVEGEIIIKKKMNQKFGGGKKPTGTPSMAWSCAVVIVSLLAGASVIHNFFKPDLTLPPMESVQKTEEKQPQKG